MKKQLLVLFVLAASLSSCLKQEINVIVEETNIVKRRINLFDSVMIVGKDSMGARYEKKERVEIKADLELDKKTGAFEAELLSQVPKYGWNLMYTLYKDGKAISNHTYKAIKVKDVEFKIFAFPTSNEKGEYKLEVIVGAYGSILNVKPYKEEFKFKND